MIPRLPALALALMLASVCVQAEQKASPRPSPTPAAPPAGAARMAAPPPNVVAIVEGAPISDAELESLAGGRLVALRAQEYDLKRSVLEEAIAERLVRREAAARGVTVEELIKAEITDKVPAVPDQEVRQYYEANKARIGPMPEAEALERIRTGMRGQREAARRGELFQQLRSKANVQVLIEPPRVDVDPSDDPSKGPRDAPVTIVEFSDFQCPFCTRVNPTLKELELRYPGKLRIVFRDLPLIQIHPNAARAAEAGSCAHEQGKFWALHDLMFQNQGSLDAAGLKKLAADAGLESAAFVTCLESGRHTAEWQKDAADAGRYGVNSTPAFFINGRLVSGARPLEDFTRIIDDELQRAAR